MTRPGIHRWPAGLVALAAAIGAASAADHAAVVDPLESAECRRSLTSLQMQEEAAASAARATSGTVAGDDEPGRASAPAAARADRPGPDPKLAASRREAARRCLASRADPPQPPQRLVRPPIEIAPPATARLPEPGAVAIPPAPLPAAATSPRGVDRPSAITTCDAGGCWANDGSRLNRVGPNLWGPRGVCTVVGSLVQCP